MTYMTVHTIDGSGFVVSLVRDHFEMPPRDVSAPPDIRFDRLIALATLLEEVHARGELYSQSDWCYCALGQLGRRQVDGWRISRGVPVWSTYVTPEASACAYFGLGSSEAWLLFHGCGMGGASTRADRAANWLRSWIEKRRRDNETYERAPGRSWQDCERLRAGLGVSIDLGRVELVEA